MNIFQKLAKKLFPKLLRKGPEFVLYDVYQKFMRLKY